MITEDRLFTCHEDCQTSFFRSLGTARLADITAISTELGKEYCVLEFSQDSPQLLQPWVIYLSCTSELDRFLTALSSGWKAIYQVPSCSWSLASPGGFWGQQFANSFR